MRVAGIVRNEERSDVDFIRSMVVLGDWIRFLAEEGEMGAKDTAPRNRRRFRVRTRPQPVRA